MTDTRPTHAEVLLLMEIERMAVRQLQETRK